MLALRVGEDGHGNCYANTVISSEASSIGFEEISVLVDFNRILQKVMVASCDFDTDHVHMGLKCDIRDILITGSCTCSDDYVSSLIPQALKTIFLCPGEQVLAHTFFVA